MHVVVTSRFLIHLRVKKNLLDLNSNGVSSHKAPLNRQVLNTFRRTFSNRKENVDHNANAAARYFEEADAAHERACYEAAQQNGHPTEEADECEGFSVGCANCPFRRNTTPESRA
ncbi:MAG: hypothetical protein CBARDCOR_6843 [uncultured Caballeronia sp.]|nr:MAG: hypothetical protein CBARDCOR_6843 [uncultured Caballeronia sp.]